MKTDQLIEMLATGAGPAPRALAARRLVPAAAFGLLASAVLAVSVLGIVPLALFQSPAPWIKFGYAAALGIAAAWWASRLGRPGDRRRGARSVVLVVVVLMLAVGMWSLTTTPAAERMPALMGHSALTCPWTVFALSLPALAGVMWALRGLAPTRPTLAGFAGGLMAGTLGAAGYALACTETSPAFIAAWYTLGIVLAGGLGGVLGRYCLRW